MCTFQVRFSSAHRAPTHYYFGLCARFFNLPCQSSSIERLLLCCSCTGRRFQNSLSQQSARDLPVSIWTRRFLRRALSLLESRELILRGALSSRFLRDFSFLTIRRITNNSYKLSLGRNLRIEGPEYFILVTKLQAQLIPNFIIKMAATGS
jgi:hypothetical protein